MNTSLILSLALFGACAANIADMYDCRAKEVKYPYEFIDDVVLKSDPPIMKCEYRCIADKWSVKMRELVVKGRRGETKTIKALVQEDESCVYDSEQFNEYGERKYMI
ncbi:hypothetical protein PRIPAC_96599 [Pristionchus pacificus]|uniref:Uncharacterized protein n=1 Tax=Pristionchus pacificus TaxID=54126 RepID=A0A454XXS1_PRIPA|nr:hypothetical protein PRIPAC_96599 [Pristionchus pacificus]|eukprot:PDM63494.1 hypothetical protein PRIPAC_53851 [Pristionchus pacificus]